MKKFIEEFKAFIMRGNVLDLAVGIIIGSAFTAIVTSLVEDMFMPVLGLILGRIDFSGLKYEIVTLSGEDTGASVNYGNFIQAVIVFLATALVVFLLVKAINSLQNIVKEEEEKPAEPEAPAPDIVLLTEIRDILAGQEAQENG